MRYDGPLPSPPTDYGDTITAHNLLIDKTYRNIGQRKVQGGMA